MTYESNALVRDQGCGLRRYRDESLSGAYPSPDSAFHMQEEEYEEFQRLVGELASPARPSG